MIFQYLMKHRRQGCIIFICVYLVTRQVATADVGLHHIIMLCSPRSEFTVLVLESSTASGLRLLSSVYFFIAQVCRISGSHIPHDYNCSNEV